MSPFNLWIFGQILVFSENNEKRHLEHLSTVFGRF